MAGKERGTIETIIHYNNYFDAGVVGAGIVTGNPVMVIYGLGGVVGGTWLERKLEKRREQA